MAITMDGIFVNGQKVTFAPEDILSADPSAYTEQIGEAVEEWMEENVTGGEQVTDTTLTLPGVPADSEIVGGKISEIEEDTSSAFTHLTNGLFNLFEYITLGEEIPLTFAAGARGASANTSVAISTSALYSCSSLIDTTGCTYFTIINLKPDKYIFVTRGYTEDEEHSGTFKSGPANILNTDLTDSGSYSTAYSSQVSAIYKNEICLLKMNAGAKYLSVHVRRTGGTNRQTGDVEDITKAFRMFTLTPKIYKDFLPAITLSDLPAIDSSKRTALGDFGELFGYGYLRIDTENKTVGASGTITFKSGSYRKNSPSFDFSNLDLTAYQTIYYDFADDTIKLVAYGAYASLEGKENTVQIGSTWIATTALPYGYFSMNTAMPIFVNGVKQLESLAPFRFKKVGLFGDSICQGQTTGGAKTTYLLQDMMGRYGLIASNNAIGGSGYCARDGRTGDICKRITTFDLTQYDYLLLFAGTNDYGVNRTVGTIADTPSNTDGNTFCSAVKYTIEYALTQKPTLEIAIITPTFRNYVSGMGTGNAYTTLANQVGYTLGDYSDALVEIGEMYNIPVYDMRKNSPINFINYESMLELQEGSQVQRLHPKSETYRYLNTKICEWLKTVW